MGMIYNTRIHELFLRILINNTGGQIKVHTSSQGVETLKAEKMVELFTGQDRPHH